MSLAPIDCDVHAAAPDAEALIPHLEPHWVDFVQSARFTAPSAIQVAFPEWSQQLRRSASELTLERLRADVLDHVHRAVIGTHYGVESSTHPYLAPALATAVNRWLRATWLERDDRLLGMAVVAPQFPEAAAAEIDRIATDDRFAAIALPARAWEPYGHDRYRPIWEAAARHGLAVAITPSGATGVPPTPLGWPGSLFEEYALGAQPFQTHVISVVMSGILEGHRGLRLVLLGSGWTWLPALMWKMDAEWRAFKREVPWVRRPPSDYVRDHVRFSVQPIDGPAETEPVRQVLEQLGSDRMMMFGSDYPHRHAVPTQEVLDALSGEARERVMSGNARDCYRLIR